jgi:ribonuclease P protein component
VAAQVAVGHILRSADFQSVLATVPHARSAHFSVHHVAARPSVAKKPVKKAVVQELSTGGAHSCPPLVDDSPQLALIGCWLGLVVPKRHAKRSVTRNLLKRQMRQAMASRAGSLPAGLWVLRLKAPFDRKLFTSPASDPLRQTAHDELQLLLQRASVRR